MEGLGEFSRVPKIISDDTGMEPEDLHEWCKRKFLGMKEIELKGERLEVVRSTTELKKDEFFEQYIDPIRRWYAQQGGYIPDPLEITM